MEKHSFRQGFETFTRDTESYDQTNANLSLHSLSDVLHMYHAEIEAYFDIEFGINDENTSHYEIVCLVDISDDKIHTMNPDLRKRYRKAGKYRRRKLEDKYHYKNPLNRIHGYIMTETSPGFAGPETLCTDVICSSNYSDIKGIGNYLMSSTISAAKKAGFETIVLEVGNSSAAELIDSSDESSGSDEDEEDDSDDSDDSDIEDLIDEVACALWKKSVRHRRGAPYYSVDECYIRNIVSTYLHNQGCGWVEPETNTDEEYGYGGYYYLKGKRESRPLMRFYESFGFEEDPDIHIEQKCFSEVPYPAMFLTLC
jgi:hypothetical protein